MHEDGFLLSRQVNLSFCVGIQGQNWSFLVIFDQLSWKISVVLHGWNQYKWQFNWTLNAYFIHQNASKYYSIKVVKYHISQLFILKCFINGFEKNILIVLIRCLKVNVSISCFRYDKRIKLQFYYTSKLQNDKTHSSCQHHSVLLWFHVAKINFCIEVTIIQNVLQS